MKRTILSEKEQDLLETLVAQHGVLVTFDNIRNLLKKQMSVQSVRNLANKLSENGWLVRIKKGVYAIANLESRGFTNLHTFKIAQVLVEKSYISFEAALQHHGMFDQHLKTIVSIASKRFTTVEIQDIQYKFIFTGKKLLYGWTNERIDNYLVKVATAEKALLDMLCFKRNVYTIDLVIEKLREYKDDFDYNRFNEYSKKQSVTVKRILGFIFDKLLIDSSFLYGQVKKTKSSSYMTKDSNHFNAKWRLYCHERFENIS